MNKFGWRPGVPDGRLWQYQITGKALPRSVDLRETGFVSPIRNQQYGNCVDHALAGIDEFLQAKLKLNRFLPAVDFLYYWVRLYERTWPQDAGSSIMDAAKMWMQHGIPPESDFPESLPIDKMPSLTALKDAAQHKLTAYYGLQQTQTDMMDVLSSGFPFADGIGIYDTFPGVEGYDGKIKVPDDHTGKIAIPNIKKDTLLGGHATGTYGYSLDPKDYTVSYLKVHIPYPHWIKKNSWGTDFGHEGWFYLPIAYLLNRLLAQEFLQAVRET